ncbi:amino acid adenylation domain-containing protein, partial [Ascidiimonas sp. W6]|uniref:non-ribosomal peptide synthetase n=1 Tax=Ascidiimonas meishanensis TaxID=3128903 RepID=UPI0030EDF626
ETLVEELGIDRDTSRNPLFDVMFSYNKETTASGASGLPFEIAPFTADMQEVSKFDMSLDTLETEDALHLGITYCSALFERSTMDRYLGYFENLIDQVLTRIDSAIYQLELLPERERRMLLEDFQSATVTYPKDQTVITLFEEQVIRTPEAVAVSSAERKLTYAELSQKVNQLAVYLNRKIGIQKSDTVGIYMDRSEETIIALLALLKIGAVFVPLDTSFSKIRIEDIVTDAAIHFVLADRRDSLPEIPEDVLVIDLKEMSWINMKNDSIEFKVSLTDLAYIIYTSGTTGKPKGISHIHDSLQDYAITFKNYFSINKGDTVIQQSKLSFDTCLEEIFPTLISGAHLAVVQGEFFDTEYLLEVIKEQKATVLSTTPLILNELNKYADKLERLRLIISGGDVLQPSHISNLRSQSEIYNTYGPSETTVCATYQNISNIENVSAIGKPIPNKRIYILDTYMMSSPLGVYGEICIAGKGVSSGYLNKPELTAAKFVADPFVGGASMYKTGDIGRWLSDGTIEFAGRKDNQLKIRGYRIELGEIESQLASHSLIQDNLVIAKENQEGKYLIAYYTASEKLTSAALRSYLLERLPAYMIPLYFVFMEEFPLNSSGKVNRNLLPEATVEAGSSFEHPENETEEQLVEIWSEVLNLAPELISATSSFFELGGHSLNAITLVNRIGKSLQVNVPLRVLFQQKTLRALAGYITTASTSAYISIPKVPEQGYYVLSSAQQRMYF